uniref:ribonuclease H n=1 Tax=Moniliophthora roreri TaxID=221103 RepID=A0A0W0FSF0_MONRR
MTPEPDISDAETTTIAGIQKSHAIDRNTTNATAPSGDRKGKRRAIDDADHEGRPKNNSPTTFVTPLFNPVASSSRSKGKQRAINEDPGTGDNTDTSEFVGSPSRPVTSSSKDKGKQRAVNWGDEMPGLVKSPAANNEKKEDCTLNHAPSNDRGTETEMETEPEVPAPIPKSRKLKRSGTGSSKTRKDLVVYCDGACSRNGKDGARAGIGVWWGHDDSRNLSERCPGPQSNISAELTAAARVLETTPINVKRKLVIKTDSEHVINSVTKWIHNWKANGWRTSKGEPVKHSELIRYLSTLIECREKIGQTVVVEHVRGHSGIEGNEGADHLANKGALLPERVLKKTWAEKEKRYRAWAFDAQPIQIDGEGTKLSFYRDSLEGTTESKEADPRPPNENNPAPGPVAKPSRSGDAEMVRTSHGVNDKGAASGPMQLKSVGPPRPYHNGQSQLDNSTLQTPQKTPISEQEQRWGELVLSRMKKRPSEGRPDIYPGRPLHPRPPLPH